MTEFAVRVEGEPEGKGFWVLAVDTVGDRFLLANEDQTFRWVDIADCKFIKAINPEAPKPVVAVQPREPTLVKPTLHLKPNGR